MNKYEKAIRYFEEHLAVLENHCKHGGEFAFEAREHTRAAIKALRKQVPRALVGFCNGIGDCPTCGRGLDDNTKHCDDCDQLISPFLSYCVSMRCAECKHNNSGKVCDLYPDKVDEIKRIHEEADNVSK